MTIVDRRFRAIDGPTDTDYLPMLAGTVAYFGLFASLEAAKSEHS